MIENFHNIHTVFIRLDKATSLHFSDYHIFYIISGNLRIQSTDMRIYPAKKDIILFPPETSVSVFSGNDNLIFDITIPNILIPDEFSAPFGTFFCNSSSDKQHDYTRIRGIIESIMTVSGTASYPEIYYLSMQENALLYCLCNYHFIKNKKESESINDLRASQIKDFIRLHYPEKLTLPVLSSHTSLSVSFLSHFFSDYFGMTFTEYLKRIRIDAAKKALLTSDISVSVIAQDCGFSEASNFIKIFKTDTGLTPLQYRKNLNHLAADTIPGSIIPVQKKTLPELENEFSGSIINISADADEKGVFFTPLYRSGILVSSAGFATSRELAEELAQINRTCKLAYGAISFVISTIIRNSSPDKYNFYHLTYYIRQLKELGITPYLLFDFRLQETDKDMLLDNELFMDILEQLLLYFINTFGSDYLESWIYVIEINQNALTADIESPQHFAIRFSSAYRLIKRLLPNAQIGGFDQFSFTEPQTTLTILDILKTENIHPDFLSFNMFPYDTCTPGQKSLCLSSDPDKPKKDIIQIRRLLQSYYKKELPPLYVSCGGISVGAKSWINDTCFVSSFIAKTLADLSGLVDLFCFYQMSDIVFSANEDHRLLNGRNGLFSQFGLPKPGFFVYSLMGRLSNRLIKKGSDHIIIRNGNSSWQVLLYNHIMPNEWYCRHFSDDLEPASAYSMFNPGQTKHFSISINNVREDRYKIVSYHLGRGNGSLFDEWEKIRFSDTPDMEEMNYLKQAVHPVRNYSEAHTKDDTLFITMDVLPFEVVLVEISVIV